jgi:probable O-glycosylation ligase (exosortase A-associated)
MGLRDLVLSAVLLASLPLAVARPFVGLLVFSWLAYMRPADMAWRVNDFRPSLVVGAATLVGILLRRDERVLLLEKRTVLLAVFLACVGASAFVAPDPASSFADGNLADLAKILFVALLTTGLASTQERVRWLLLVIAGSLGALALKASLAGVLHPGLAVHGPGGAIQDTNDFGLALVMALPLLVYLARDERGPALQAMLGAMACACVAGILFTRSRGGVVALAAMALVWMWKLRRNGWALVFAPLVAAAAVVLAPPQLFERVRNLSTGSADPSVEGRLVAWQKAISMARENPVFGVGPGNFLREWAHVPPEAAHVPPVVAHNTYLQILAESGAVTLAVYAAALVLAIVALARLRREAPQAWRRRYADAILLSLVGFSAGAFFLSRTHFDLVYHLIGISVALASAREGGEPDFLGLRRLGLIRAAPERGPNGA